MIFHICKNLSRNIILSCSALPINYLTIRMSSDFASSHFVNTFFLLPIGNNLFQLDIRAKYRDASETFDVKDLASRDPIKQFDDWFQQARKNPEIREPVI